MLPRISIVIPSYNKAEYIGSTLRSIVGQKYLNLEVIVQDGGSTDGTLEIIKSYAKKYPRIIKWESKKDKGQTDAINKGLKKATGDVLAYINADDVYEPGALKAVGEYFSKNPKTLWLAGKGKVVDKDGKEIAKPVTAYKNLLLFLNRRTLLLVVNYFMQPSVFISGSAYRKHGPFTGTEYGVMEYGLWLKLSHISMPKVLNKCLSGFRLTKGTASAIQFNEILAQDMRIVKKYTENPFVLFLHKLNNLMRTFLAREL